MTDRSSAALPPKAMREAIDWHLTLETADTDRWHAFVLWLEADADHRAAYDRVTQDDALLQSHPLAPAVPLASVPMRAPLRPARRRAWAAGLVALMAAGAATFVTLRPRAAPSRYAIESTARAGRSVQLADGTRITLNRATRLLLDRNDPRVAVLELGEATFAVHHDAAAPFEVTAAGQMIQDVGTVFDVVANGDRLSVGVAEGSVLYQPHGAAVVLKPGMTLRTRPGGPAELGRMDKTAIGGWRHGVLQFADAPLDDVVADVGRATGVAVRIAPSLAERRFSGVLRADRDPRDVVETLAALSGTTATQQRDGWLIAADSDAAR
ncbi:MAG: hypothetical protein JWO65_411 [Sphingomonas bacterium]|nr:hypothetical protein [Sphingomonas bacterium]